MSRFNELSKSMKLGLLPTGRPRKESHLLGKHWRDTKGGAPFQCSQESDLNFHVEPNEFLHL